MSTSGMIVTFAYREKGLRKSDSDGIDVYNLVCYPENSTFFHIIFFLQKTGKDSSSLVKS